MVIPDGFVLIGSVGVDSGTLMIGDPCYLDGGFDYDEWTDACNFDKEVQPGPSDFAKPGQGLTVAANTAWGDGTYPVYAKYNTHGRIAAMLVVTDDIEGEDEWL